MQLTTRRGGLVVAGLLAACGGDPAPDAAVDARAADAPVDAAIDAPIDGLTVDAPGVCDDERRDDDYAPGLEKVGAGGYRVILLGSEPGPPARGNNAWQIRVRDPQGAARPDLTIRVYPYMPDHGHGTSVMAVVTATQPPGDYDVERVNLFMAGLWSVRLGLADAGAPQDELDAATFWFCVN